MPFDVDRYQSLRSSRLLGASVHHLDETGSTMDDAREGARRGEPAGSAYVAAAQTAGRGRQGRSWVSEPGAGLWVTYHLRFASPPPLLTIAGGLAVRDAIEAAVGLTCDLKWPNDVQRGGRKLCGILAESSPSGEGVDVFLGIGINLRTPEGMPPEVLEIATSIEQEGRPAPSREVLLAALSSALERRVEQAEREPRVLLADWRACLVTLGQHVRITLPDGSALEGVAEDVEDDGALVVRVEGERRVFRAGDVTSTRPVQ